MSKLNSDFKVFLSTICFVALWLRSIRKLTCEYTCGCLLKVMFCFSQMAAVNPAGGAEEHVLSGGVVFSLVLFMFGKNEYLNI